MRQIQALFLPVGLLSLILFTGAASPALSQDKATTQGSAAEAIPHLNDQDNDANPAKATMEAKARQQRLAEQQRKWIADATQLAILANDLKASMEKAGGATLPADGVQKAAEIEKLAKRLKDQMRNP